jgi:hypothetical protein
MSAREHKALENQLRRQAKRKGLLLRRSRIRDRWPDDFGLYVLVDDCRGNRLPGACAPYAALRHGWGDTLAGIAEELSHLRDVG